MTTRTSARARVHAFIHRARPGRWLLGAAAGLWLAAAGAAPAEIATWDGGSTPGAGWGTKEQWSNNVAPTFSTTCDVHFYQSGATNLNPNLIGANRKIRSLTYNVNADSNVVTQFQTGTPADAILIFEGDAGASWINVDSGAAGSFTLGSGTRGGMILANPLTVTHNGPGLLTFNRPVAGTNAGLIKAGTGILVLITNNTFDGGVTLNAGVLRINLDGSLGPNTLTANGGTLASASATARAVTNAILFAGNLTAGEAATGTGPMTFIGPMDLGGAVRRITAVVTATCAGGLSNGGLAKAGAAPLTLTATNAYTGETRVEAGRLALYASGHAGGAIAVSNGATLRVTLLGPDTLRASAVTLGGAATGRTTNDLQLGSFAGLTVPVLHATNLTVNGTNVLNLTGIGFATGQFPVITYGSASGLTDSSFALGSLPPGVGASLTNNTGNRSVDLVITRLPYLLWRAQADNNWDAATTNWQDALTSADAIFFDGAIAIFDDAASNTTVVVPADVAPVIMLLNNSASNYSFSGAGRLGGGALIVGGGGRVSLGLASNTYASDTLISNGTLSVEATNAIPDGAGRGNVLVNGVFELNGIDEAINGLSGHGLITNAGGVYGATNTLTVGGNNASGVFGGRLADDPTVTAALALTKTGSGSLTLSGSNAYAGATVLGGGAVRVGEYALGPGYLTLSGSALSSDGAGARLVTNDFSITAATTLGDAIDNGPLTFTGGGNLGGGGRALSIPSDVVFAGPTSNGYLSAKNGPGTLTLRGTNEWSGGSLEIREGLLFIDGGSITNDGGVRPGCNVPFGTARMIMTNGASFTYVAAGGNQRVGNAGATTATNFLELAGAIRFPIANASNGRLLIANGCAYARANLWPGGDIEVNYVDDDGGTGPISELSFRGGILRARSNNTDFIRRLEYAYVRDGGAIFDTQGYDITVNQPLLNGGSGGLTKDGLGRMTLTGTNTYVGLTAVNAGELALTPQAHGSGGAIDVAGGAGLRVEVPAAGTTLAASSLTAADGGRLTFSLGALGNPAAPVIAAPAFAPSGTVTVQVEGVGSALSLGTFTLVDYSSPMGGGGFAALTLGSLPAGVQAALVDNVANASVDLNITGFVAVVWRGQTDTAWDTSTLNWVEPVGDAPAFYTEGIIARFEDIASNASVVVTNTRTPLRTVIDNATLRYAFGGAGAIGGAGQVVKTGTGAVSMALAGNSYAGDTLISNGVYALGAGEVIPHGAGKGNVLVEGILDLAGNSETVNGLNGGGAVTNGGGAVGTTNILIVGSNNASGVFGGPIADDPSAGGALALTKAGTGELTLSGESAYAGGTTLAAGTLRVGHNRALGLGRLTANGGTVSSDGAAARSLSNSVTITAAATLGDAVNRGILTFNGGVNLSGGTRGLTLPSDVVFAGGATNGGVNKFGPAWLTFRGYSSLTAASEVREGTVALEDGATMANIDTLRAVCTAANSFSRIVIGSNATFSISSATANLRVGFTGGNATSTNIWDISGPVRLPNTTSTDGSMTMGQNAALAVCNLWPGGDLELWRVQHNGAGPTNVSEFNFRGGVLRPRGSITTFMQGLTGAYVRDGGAIFDTQGFDITVAQPLLSGGAGGLEKRGTGSLTLATNESYVGRTTVAGGMLILGASASITSSPAIEVRSGAILDVSAVSGFAVAPGQTLMGNGTVLGGVTVDGALSPGASIGTLLFANDLVLAAGSVTTMEIAKAGASLSSDKAIVAGAVTYGGSLVVPHTGDALAAGDAFALFSTATFSNWFSAVSLPALAPGLGWDTNKLRTAGVLEVMATATPDGGALRTLALVGGLPTLTFTGTVGASYVLQTATNLIPEPVTWVGISTSVVPPSGILTNNDPAATNRVKYYRTVVP